MLQSPDTSPQAVPELGPLLGRLTEPARPVPGAVPLDDIRLGLVTELFELAAAARDFAGEGDTEGAVQSLNRHAWAAAWERAVSAAADRIATRIDERLSAAATESRLPRTRRERLLLTAEERRGIEVRIGVGGAALFESLDQMEARVRQASRGGNDPEVWKAALVAVARRVESAWLALEEAAAREEAAWEEDVGHIRAWRRPRWPLWLVTALIAALVLWLGLALGGFLPLPAPLEPFADWWWERI